MRPLRTLSAESLSPAADAFTEELPELSIAQLAGNLADPHPISLAADGTAVYASTASLYVASNQGAKTQLHRFDITTSGKPRYLGSGAVPGALLDSYSMSEYNGSLRVVTTQFASYAGPPTVISSPDRTYSATAVYVLNADTLKARGHVGGLGRGEQVHAVRFLGPLA